MIRDEITIKNIQGITDLSVTFEYPESSIIVITGENGVGKTTLVKAFRLVSDPQVFQKTSGLNSIRHNSEVQFTLFDFPPFGFSYNGQAKALDSKDILPPPDEITAELPIPFGQRFHHFSLVSIHDAELRANIASTNYSPANELIAFLNKVYSTDRYSELKCSSVNRYLFYFFLKEDDYYLREDHLSSGEFFLIQIFRLIVSGSKLVVIDELDVALDASAQVNLYSALRPLLEKYESRLIVISHSLAFMETVDEGGLYYLEMVEGIVGIERRSFGYVKSDLYGFRGKDRFIITEDKVLAGLINYLIKTRINYFFEYEVIEVGGQPQVDAIATKNDTNHIFGEPYQLLIVVDKDIFGALNYRGPSIKCSSPVDDVELFIWQNKDRLLHDVEIPEFRAAIRDKNTAKTYWKKVISSGQKNTDDLYELICVETPEQTAALVEILASHLCLDKV